MKSKNLKEKGAEISLADGALSKIQTRGFCALKQGIEKGRDTLTVNSGLKKPEFCESVSFPHIRG